ncbi:phytanoyl-CoA dioxygenase family protein [Fulvivirga sp. 29W222]|uniref:Phytanoyl-CoA dioxygenase family protein n=2 Tax=Fulvivirga marina TaxID=2494733 RepID=A0A937FXS4_9BACT|nr:phytanoyl-CoA dioxygenase family protein [Fulvivirga marina]
MNVLYFDSDLTDNERRQGLYQGQLFTYSPFGATYSFCYFADALIREAFAGFDPEYAQWELPVNQYVDILKALKPRFIHHNKSKEFIQQILRDKGCDLNKTYFDLPRLRTSTSDGYLTSGIAYAFHPHRDTWYSAPMSQVNWWIPIYTMAEENGLALHPKYWSRPIANDSREFSYQEWVNGSRKTCAENISSDKRWQPSPQERVEMDSELRIIPEPGGIIMFSAAHLHASVPNTSGKTRFSIDFRTINIDDVVAGVGAPNIDTACKGEALVDFIRASDFAPFPEELIYQTV